MYWIELYFGCHQWRTQKIFMGRFHSVACGGHLYLVCAVCDVTIWRHIHVSKERFGDVCWRNMHISRHALPYVMCHCNEYKLSALQVRISEEYKLNATTQQFVISSCALKQGSNTHSSLRPSNLQRQNQAALMSCRKQAVEHRKRAAELTGACPGLKDGTLINYTRVENAHKVRKTTWDFLLCIEVQQTFGFPFFLLWHYQMPEYFYVKNCFWARAAVLPCYRNW